MDKRLDSILQLNGREILNHAGKISHQMALNKSEVELEIFKEIETKNEIEKSLKELENDIKKMKN